MESENFFGDIAPGTPKQHKYHGRKAWDLSDEELDELQRDVNKVLAPYTGKPNLLVSYFYLFLSCFYCWVCYEAMQFLVGLGVFPYWFLWGVYAVVAGQPATGAWCCAHEAGHGAFGATKLQNDIPGFIVHSLLLVPYYSWSGSIGSHAKHHANTNSLLGGDSHVPPTRKGAQIILNLKQSHEDAFVLFKTVYTLLLGWPLYLVFNTTGGRVNATDMKTPLKKGWFNKSHFAPGSQVLPQRLGNKVLVSTLGCIATLCGVFLLMEDPWFWYFGPLLVVNANLVGITYLQHTHESIPHFGADQFRFLKGALCTIDRPMTPLINHLHHSISSSHVCHHVNSRIPHYRAVPATKELKELLGPLYNYDDRPILKAMWETQKRCEYVDGVTGVQYYKSH